MLSSHFASIFRRSFSHAAPAEALTKVRVPSNVIHVKLDNGITFALSPLQLRERCGSRQVSTGQRLFEMVDQINSSEIRSLRSDASGFDVIFEDGLTARFLASEFAAEIWREKELQLPTKKPWSNDLTVITILRSLFFCERISRRLTT